MKNEELCVYFFFFCFGFYGRSKDTFFSSFLYNTYNIYNIYNVLFNILLSFFFYSLYLFMIRKNLFIFIGCNCSLLYPVAKTRLNKVNNNKDKHNTHCAVIGKYIYIFMINGIIVSHYYVDIILYKFVLFLQ